MPALAARGRAAACRGRVRELAGDADALMEQRILKVRLEQIDAELAELRGLLDSLAATLKTPAY